MAYLLALTVTQVLIVILYLKIRTIRDERVEMIRFLLLTGAVILMVKYFVPVLNSHIGILFTATSSLCLVSITSLYLRNIALETRTSIYLFLLALFPFILFYVFYLLFNIYSSQITDGMIYDYLDFFYQKSRTILFFISVVYDLFILWPWRRKVGNLVNSIDGQLAFYFFSAKILTLSIILSRGLFIDSDLFFEFLDGLFTVMIFLGIIYYRYYHALNIYFGYLFKTNGMVKQYEEEQAQLKQTELIFYISAIDQLIDQENLFKNPDLKLSDFKKFMPISDLDFKNLSKKYLNGSFENYLNNKRINYFLERLKSVNHDSERIISLLHDAGFKNDHEFSKFFKKQMGCSVWKYAETKRMSMYESGLSSTFK